MQPTKLADYAVQAILKMITEGRWKVGDLLPSQRDLAEKLGMSRPSLREAISTLEGRGIVRAHAGKGVYVTALPSADARRQLEGSEIEGVLRPHDIYQLRYALEPFVVGLVAQSIGAEELTRLQLNLLEMKSAIDALDIAAAVELDLEFHRMLVGFTTNPAFREVVEQAAGALTRSRGVMKAHPTDMHEPWREHERIYRALRQRDSTAAMQAMREHIANAARRLGIEFAVPHTIG